MTKKEKFDRLIDNLNDLSAQVRTEKVEMSEHETENKELSFEDKINDIHDLLFTESSEDDFIDEPVQEEEVAMSEAEDTAIAAVAEATAVADEVSEPAVEAQAEAVAAPEAAAEPVSEEIDYKSLYEAQAKDIEELKAKFEAAQSPSEPELKHDPEAAAEKEHTPLFGSPGFKPMFTSPQDNVFAALNLK